MVFVALGFLIGAVQLPVGSEPEPVACPHFPDAIHAFVWRNWQLVPVDRMAKVVGAKPSDIVRIGEAMGLTGPPPVTKDVERRSYITVIRRNWHLLPYNQLLELLDWTPEQLAFTLREDDFLYIKLGHLKPKCAPVKYSKPTPAILGRERDIARIVRTEFPDGVGKLRDPLFGFVNRLSRPMAKPARSVTSDFSPRFCYSYFALYGDPLLEKDEDPFPDGYLSRLAASGVDGVWLQAVLYKLTPFPWDATRSAHYQERLANLCALVARAKAHGIGVYLYLNEPRAMPLSFFKAHPDLKGVTEGNYAALCTSVPAVQEYLTNAVASLCSAVPDLAGLFTITASENLTNCWSHNGGVACPRCSKRTPAAVIAEVDTLIQAGIHKAGSHTRLIVWDWGWSDKWALDAIKLLPKDASFMSVSEWGLPIDRGGVAGTIGEYSISAIGPGPRARKHWAAARKRGMKIIAKIQANNTWELSAVPYIPAVANVAQHAANLRDLHVDGLMLGWTLGGYPSPNLEVVAEIGNKANATESPDAAMHAVAVRRFGAARADTVVAAWRAFSAAFREFPFGSGLYTEPMQMGPANPLWEKPTHYAATMVGFPYDDLRSWRGAYPVDTYAGQLNKVADGFEKGIETLRSASAQPCTPSEAKNFAGELRVAEAAAIHFRSAANQARFVAARDALLKTSNAATTKPLLEHLEHILRNELALANRLYGIQTTDSRIGYEASNQYFYVPVDLAEKVLNCRDLMDRWLPAQRKRLGL